MTPSSAGDSKNVDDDNDDPFAPFIAKDDTNNIMDLNNITVKLLPDTCEVTLIHIKDPHLVSIGHYDNLPNLKLCGLMSWRTSGQAKKHKTKVMSVHGWMKCIPTLNKVKLVQGLMFARSGDYYNPSVADPRDFEVHCLVPATNDDPVPKELGDHTTTYDSLIKTYVSRQGFARYNYDEDVPIYDAHTTDFNFNNDLGNLNGKLPDWKCKVPVGACCAILYIAQSYTWNGSLHLKLFLQWVIVLGTRAG
ncbi:hypothetical protein FA15DRAFT_704646 [Coprinopsis marcescibilis]|uniref:Uncharacterized protein n=1 Tax=Coprinopsis marcescibilis TaxID=230819 RepID=A0A5C3KUV5_COPMA|nr:hypothetical protein FA15DRAFT_704646 [Coprinopsis marcescibilis]